MVSASDIQNAGILIVDDRESNVKLLTQMLSSAGYTRVSSTMDPYAVCALHRDNNYDLILLDLQMPGMDGFQVMEGLKAIERDSYVPVLVITAQPGHKMRALEAGAKDFISKPFDLIEVKTRIRNLLEVRILYKKIENYNKELEKTVAERTGELLGANEQLLREIEQRKGTEESLRRAYTEIEQLKDRLLDENIGLHKGIDFQEQLVSDLSHQLRTPLTSMRGTIEVAMHKARSADEYRAILEGNLAEIDRITALVNTMLMLAKLDGHIERLKYEPYNLVKMLEETIGDLAPLWAEKSIHFIYRFFRNRHLEEFRADDAGVPRIPAKISDLFDIELDTFRFKQAIINILDNAYKYTPYDGLITIELYPEVAGDAGTCCFVIMNNGPSIPEATLPNLFTRFFQVDVPERRTDKRITGSIDEVARGFGLGLSICRRIVEMHQGKIRAFNPEGGGAAFEIIIPVRQESA